jgi:hypothetical protein
MTKPEIFTGKLDDAHEYLHDVSMDGDAAQACAARCLKEILPRFSEWLVAEINRGTSPKIAAEAMNGVVLSLVGTVIQNAEQNEFKRQRIIAGCVTAIALTAVAYANAQDEARKAKEAGRVQ